MDRPVNIREVDACRIISMTRVVSIDELGPFMDEAFGILERLAPGDPTLGKASPLSFTTMVSLPNMTEPSRYASRSEALSMTLCSPLTSLSAPLRPIGKRGSPLPKPNWNTPTSMKSTMPLTPGLKKLG